MKKDYDQHKADFLTFHRNNPHIWKLLIRFARQATRAGLSKLSIALLIERVRWEVYVVTRSTDGYKINNNFGAFYARKLNRLDEFAGMFEIRKQLSRNTVR
jgi:hypothetical protein